MAYCTRDNLLKRYGEGPLDELTDSDSAILDPAIADADEQIDRKLRGRYAVPVTPAPAELVDIACALAFWNLYRGRTAPEEVQKRADAALRELRDYATGTNVLDVPAGKPTSPAATVVVAPPAVFGNDTLARMP